MEVSVGQSVALLKLLQNAEKQRLSFKKLQTLTGLSSDVINVTLENTSTYFPNLISAREDSIVLEHPLDFLDEKFIFKKIHGKGRVQIFDEIDSTNTRMLKLASNLVSGDVLMAEIQTAGRGRRGGKWNSGLGSCIMLSMAWHFSSHHKLLGLSVAAGVSAAMALQPFTQDKITVKWPNDLYLPTGKISGILIESVPSLNALTVVIGIGVNVSCDPLTKSNETRAIGFLREQGTSGLRNQVAIALIDGLRKCCAAFEGSGLNAFKEELLSRDHLKGLNIKVSDGERCLEGIAVGIDDDGELIIDTNGDQRKIAAGHVECW